MARDRFFYIMRNLHFSDNNDERSRVDRIWKIRPVVDALQKTFKSGYVPPPRLSFDEGMLPSFSSYNKTRIYLKAKPHKWGTKMFLTCCAESAYCLRFEIYAGKKQLASEQPGVGPVAMPEGPAAVVRNMRAVLGPRHPEHYLVVTDRFYTCAALAVQLLAMNVYILGTALPTRLGFCKSIVPPKRQKRRPQGMTRGAHTVAVCKSVQPMKACVWWDNKPVLFLTTGGSTEPERIARREGAQQVEVPCPKFVKQYQSLMGGVDRHDQLRLQRYSLQLSNRWLKYYKSLFFGLVDMAAVNAYIIYCELHRRRQLTPPLSHVQFLKELHLQLLQLNEADVAQSSGLGLMSPTPTPPSRSQTAHVAVEVDEWQTLKASVGTEHSKRRQRSCKVCSLLRGERKRGYQTTFYCARCSDGKKRVYLCTRARRSVKGAPVTCFDLWHHDWQCGRSLPQGLTLSMIRARAPAMKPQKRRRLDSELADTIVSDDEQDE